MEDTLRMSVTKPPKPYQVEPIEMFRARGTLLLAFDTGLGKTYCAIACAEELLELRKIKRCLMVVPASLKYQWGQSLAEFTDMPTREVKLKGETLTVPAEPYCVIVDGTPKKRAKQYKLALDDDCDYVIIGYDNVSSDERAVKRLRADMAVLDEASAIKTFKAARTQQIKEKLVTPYRLALTATPVENRPDEVFSIMEWVDQDVLGRADLFDRAYIERNDWGDIEGYKNLPTLYRRLSVGMCRKSVDDPDVAPYMPRRDTTTWTVPMDAPTAKAYKVMAADLLAALKETGDKGRSFSVDAHYAGHGGHDETTAVGRVMAIHQCMEMLLDHPDLVIHSGIIYGEKQGKGSRYAHSVWQNDHLDDVVDSPKLAVLVGKLGKALRDPSSKVVVFTRYRVMLDLLNTACLAEGWPTVLYHGDLTVPDKAAAVARFQRGAARIMLSSHAGAYGTDMPWVNWLINYDPMWSSGKADQTNGRHMRASSDFDEIYVRNMVVEGSVEERKLAQQELKRRVAKAAVDGTGADSDGSITNDVESLTQHLQQYFDDGILIGDI